MSAFEGLGRRGPTNDWPAAGIERPPLLVLVIRNPYRSFFSSSPHRRIVSSGDSPEMRVIIVDALTS